MKLRVAHNQAHWDSVVDAHLASDYYKADRFRRGEIVLDPIARDRLGDIAGMRLLHLQCHIGLDSLSMVRLGAEVTGLDLSPKSIEAARTLARETGLDGTFVVSDVTDPSVTLEGFDIAFASWGCLLWIEDLHAWMRVAANALRPGGRLVLINVHPVMMMLNEFGSPTSPLTVRYPYRSSDPVDDESVNPDYADPAVQISSRTFTWQHGIGEVLSAAIAAGFEIRAFEELDRIIWGGLPQLEKRDDFFWSLPEGRPFVPLAFALEARVGGAVP
jgi:SAM-dependent methyltransferase